MVDPIPSRSEYIRSSVNMDTVVFLLEDFSSIALTSAIDSLQPFMNVFPHPKSCGYVARILRQAYRITSFNISMFNKTNDPILDLTPENITQHSGIE